MSTNPWPTRSRVQVDKQALHLVLLAVPPLTGLDVIGPAEVFAAANRLLNRDEPGYAIELVTNEPNGLISGPSGLSIVAHRHYSRIDQPIDTLLVMGGPNAPKACGSEVLTWIQKMAPRVRRLGSVCTGALLLAEAGLLDDKCATTHWMYTREMANHYPRIQVDEYPIWIQDGHIFTSAGVTSGMDLALAMVEEDFGGKLALDVARFLVLFLRRPGGQAQFSVALSAQAPKKRSFHELQGWIADHLSESLTVDSLASHLGMSPRNFARVFIREMGITPARYISRLRLEAARQALEQTDHGLERIASDCGYGSADHMRRAFIRHLGITPVQHRSHFCYLGQA